MSAPQFRDGRAVSRLRAKHSVRHKQELPCRCRHVRAHLVAGRDSVLSHAAAPPVRAAAPCVIKTSHDMRPPTES